MANEQVGGHRSLPHTADVRIEAWAPSVAGCLEQAVAGLVSTFADLSAARPTGVVTASLSGASPGDLLVSVLDEVIFRLDTEAVLPLRSDVQLAETGSRVVFEVANAASAELIGAVPKATSLHCLVSNSPRRAGGARSPSISERRCATLCAWAITSWSWH